MKNIIERTNEIRDRAKKYGKYRHVSRESGVGYEWLVKFAAGKIGNPRVESVSALEDFFKKNNFCDSND
jgi:hypothetical protein